MNTKKLDEIMNNVNAAAAAKANEIENVKTEIEMAQQSITAANDAMTRASDAGDVEAYKAAKVEKQNATDAQEMYNTRLEKLTVKPSMTEAEYKQARKDAEDAAAIAVNDAKQKLADLTDKMLAIRAELIDVADKVNKITQKAFEETYPTPECKTESGAMPIWYEYKGAQDAIAWAGHAASGRTYQNMKKGKKNE